jgi:hypothetical protein
MTWNVDHHGVAAHTERRQCRSRQQDRRQEIHVQHRVDLSLSRHLQPAGADAAGVVHQDVETAERVERMASCLGSSIGRANVGDNASCLSLCSAQLGQG